jgi:hypothetical protein
MLWGVFMAIQAVQNVLYLPLKPGLKLTLTVLSEHANEEGICWPSQKLLSIRTSISTRKVRDHLRLLESGGWLITYVGRGPKFVNLYQLNLEQINIQAKRVKEQIEQDKNERKIDLADPQFATSDLSDITADFENTPPDESDNNPGPTGPIETSTNLHIKPKRKRSLELSGVTKLQKLVTVSTEAKQSAIERLRLWAEFESSDEAFNSHQQTSLQTALTDVCSIVSQTDLILELGTWDFLNETRRNSWISRISESYQQC